MASLLRHIVGALLRDLKTGLALKDTFIHVVKTSTITLKLSLATCKVVTIANL